MSESSVSTQLPERPENKQGSVSAAGRFRLTGILLLVIAAELVLWLLAGRPIHEAVDYFRTGRYEAARIHLERSDWYPLRRSDRDWVAAATALATGGDASAELDRIARRGRRIFPPLTRDTVLETLIRQSRFEQALAWSDAANVIGGESDREQLLRAAAFAATGEVENAEGLLSLVRRADEHETGLELVRRAVVDRRRGLVPVVVDANGAVLAFWRVNDGKLVITDPAGRDVVESIARQGLIEGPWPTLHTPIDLERQRALQSVVAATPGTIAVVEIESRRLVALVGADSRRIDARAAIGDLARAVVPPPQGGVYPVICDGILRVEGAMIADSGRHGEVPDHESALAWSCAVAAARAALAAGPNEVAASIDRAGFQSGAINALPALARVPTDSGNVTATPMELAAFAAAVADDGLRVPPRLVERLASILGEPLDGQLASAVPVGSASEVSTLAESMRRSVVEARGEAHAIAILGHDAAAMFGNARGAAGGYASRIIAYAPAEEPRFAIGIVLDGGGPAKGVAGRVVGEVLDTLDYRSVAAADP